jgi:hypothetical protein
MELNVYNEYELDNKTGMVTTYGVIDSKYCYDRGITGEWIANAKVWSELFNFSDAGIFSKHFFLTMHS